MKLLGAEAAGHKSRVRFVHRVVEAIACCSEPEGFTAISRRLSEAIRPDHMSRIPKGCQQRAESSNFIAEFGEVECFGEVLTMFEHSTLVRAVDLQHRSFLLLRWLINAVKTGLIEFRTAHRYATLPEAAAKLIREHYLDIPANARPAEDDVPVVAAFLTTYLENSYDLIENPGKRLYSPDNHCFCSMCSWLVNAPNLKSKRITPSDKREAGKLRVQAMARLATECKLDVSNDQMAVLLSDDAIREDVSLVAYGLDLFQRMDGVANGPAILALWRSFAWTREGSPIHDFRLTAERILAAEQNLIGALRQQVSK